jgi:hypothetical protein
MGPALEVWRWTVQQRGKRDHRATWCHRLDYGFADLACHATLYSRTRTGFMPGVNLNLERISPTSPEAQADNDPILGIGRNDRFKDTSALVGRNHYLQNCQNAVTSDRGLRPQPKGRVLPSPATAESEAALMNPFRAYCVEDRLLSRHSRKLFEAARSGARYQGRRTGESTVESNNRIKSERCLTSGAGQLVADVGVGWDKP